MRNHRTDAPNNRAPVRACRKGPRVKHRSRYWQQLTPAVDFHIDGGIIYADSSYNSTYFSIGGPDVGYMSR